MDTPKKTQYQEEREARELAIYTDWTTEMAKPGAMTTAVDKYIMEKYNIHSASTIWSIRKRVEKRQANLEPVKI